MIIMTVVTKYITAFMNLIKCYKNWPAITMSYMLKRNPRELVLRTGQRLPSSVDFYALMRLMLSGWKIEDVDKEFMSILNTSGVRMKCRLSMGADLRNLVEIYLDRCYGSDFAGKVVIDVGMVKGDSSVYFATQGARLVIGVEHFPPSFSLALENIGANRLRDRILPLLAALSSSEGSTDLTVSPESPQINSITPADNSYWNFDPGANNKRITIRVEGITLIDVVRRFNLERIDFLKLDCEGCEYRVIRNLSTELLGKLREIVIELHNGPQDLPELLRKQGFEVSLEDSNQSVGYLHAIRLSSCSAGASV
jgi:FkbM family methyltransferase